MKFQKGDIESARRGGLALQEHNRQMKARAARYLEAVAALRTILVMASTASDAATLARVRDYVDGILARWDEADKEDTQNVHTTS